MEQKEYTSFEMLYATHVIEKKRKIDSVPASIRDRVREIVVDSVGEGFLEE